MVALCWRSSRVMEAPLSPVLHVTLAAFTAAGNVRPSVRLAPASMMASVCFNVVSSILIYGSAATGCRWKVMDEVAPPWFV